MLATITLLTSFCFAVTYPLCFLVSAKDPLKNKFHHFHIGLPTVIAGVVLIFILSMDFPSDVKISASIWCFLLSFICFTEWKKNYLTPGLVYIPVALGIYTFIKLHNVLLPASYLSIIVWILSSLVFVSALFAMNLGHWYLNVHGLPIKHLRNATFVFWGFIMVRFLWDLIFVTTSSVMYRGEEISLFRFIGTLEGLLLGVAIFFGTLFPLFTLIFVKETIELKNTQSATGILYAILCAVCLGDIAYKYYFIRYAIFL